MGKWSLKYMYDHFICERKNLTVQQYTILDNGQVFGIIVPTAIKKVSVLQFVAMSIA